MGAAFLIMLREGLEMALIVAIVLAYLRQLGRRDRFGFVLLGALAGGAIALAIGIAVYITIGELEGKAEGYVEAFIALTAAVVLTWMVFWMRGQARSMGGHLRGEVDRALASGALLGLASITFIGVLREGIETSLFMLAVVFDNGVMSTLVGSVLGLSAALAIGYAFYRGGQHVNLRLFFQVTGGLVILFAAGLAAKGIFQLQALGIFNSAYWPVWNVAENPVLGTGQFAAFMGGLFGWSPQPSIEQLIVYVSYVAIAGWFFYFGNLPAGWSRAIERVQQSLWQFVSPSVTPRKVDEVSVTER